MVVIHVRSKMRTVTGRCGAIVPSVSTVTRCTRVSSPEAPMYDSGRTPAYQAAGCTVTAALLATA